MYYAIRSLSTRFFESPCQFLLFWQHNTSQAFLCEFDPLVWFAAHSLLPAEFREEEGATHMPRLLYASSPIGRSPSL